MTKPSRTPGIETRAVHAGTPPDPVTGARNMPIYQTTSYVFEDVDHASALFNLQTFGYIYTRITNPTVAALEERVASLEGGRAAVACASGHAAQLLCFYTLMEPGDEFLAARKLYGGSITQFSHTFPRLGWHGQFVGFGQTGGLPRRADAPDQGDLRRERVQPGRRRGRPRGPGRGRSRGGHPADRRQHDGVAIL